MSHQTLAEVIPHTLAELQRRHDEAERTAKETNLLLLRMRSPETEIKFKVVIKPNWPDQEATVTVGSDLKACIENAFATHKEVNKDKGGNLTETAEAFVILGEDEIPVSIREHPLIRPS